MSHALSLLSWFVFSFSDVAQVQVFVAQHASQAYHQQGDNDDHDDNYEDENDDNDEIYVVDDNLMKKMTFAQVKSGRELEKQLRRLQEVKMINRPEDICLFSWRHLQIPIFLNW